MRSLLSRACGAGALALLLVVSGCATTRTYATAPVATTSVGAAAYFWDDLSPYGHWLRHSRYGWVWTPYDTYAGWRPYTYGRWAYSDYGWTWVSYYDWGWAPFHYGRWSYDSLYGWLWVPGTTWGPAWVAWRHGGGVVGWAPLPPSAVYVPGYGIRFGRGGVDVAIGASWWVFTEPRYLSSHRVYAHTFTGQRRPAVLRSTRPVVRYDEGRHGVIHRGIDVGQVERQTRTAIPRVRDRDIERSRALSLERTERPDRAVLEGQRARPRPSERIERPPRPRFERQPMQRGEREDFNRLQRQRPEERPSRREPLRTPPPRLRPDDQLRPPRRELPPSMAERQRPARPDRSRVERPSRSGRDLGRVRPDRPSRGERVRPRR